MATTRPFKRPRPGWRPYSSLSSKRSCIPRQMPSSGLSGGGLLQHHLVKARDPQLGGGVPKGAHAGEISLSPRRSTAAVAADGRLGPDKLQGPLEGEEVATP